MTNSNNAGHNITFEDLAKSHEIQAEIVRNIQVLNDFNPADARGFVLQLARLVGVDVRFGVTVQQQGHATVKARGSLINKGATAYDRVAGVFLKNGNKPLSKEAIAKAAETTAGSVHTVIYNSKSDMFERVPDPSGGREALRRLTQAALEEAQRASPALNGARHDA